MMQAEGLPQGHANHESQEMHRICKRRIEEVHHV